jgi:hypothetical protein
MTPFGRHASVTAVEHGQFPLGEELWKAAEDNQFDLGG